MTKLVYEPSQTCHWKTLFPNKMLLLGSQNLNAEEELVAKIKTASVQEIKNQQGQEERVPVLTFDNAPPMVLNITNARTIANLYGEQYDNWVGKSIQIYATEVKAFGVEQMALRIRGAIPDTGEENIDRWEKDLRACTSMQDLQKVFTSIPMHLKARLASVKDEMKESLS